MAAALGLYVSAGAQMAVHLLDPDGLTLCKQRPINFPSSVQYAWQHPRLPLLYVATADRDAPAARSTVAVTAIDPDTGDLVEIVQQYRLRSRPIHLTLDPSGAFLFVVYGGSKGPSGIDVFSISLDGLLGEQIPQSASVEVGTFPHQVRVFGERVFVCARGTYSADDPGAIKVFAFPGGRLSEVQWVAPHGVAFKPRHLDVHPSGRWLFVALERENLLQVFELDRGVVRPAPLFEISTLRDPTRVMRPQNAGAIHVNADGTRVYVSNRGYAAVPAHDKKLFAGGENSIAVFEIDPATGHPRMMQSADTHNIHPRTFSIASSERFLASAGLMEMEVEREGVLETIPRRLSLFEIGDDGTLRLAKLFDLDDGDPFWCGFWRPARSDDPDSTQRDLRRLR